MKTTVHIVSHSHWDREWYLPFEKHRMHLVELVDAILEKFETDEEYQEFLNMTQSTSLYNTGVEVTTADTIVTLSTCTSASDNHRFVVRGVKEEETKQ